MMQISKYKNPLVVSRKIKNRFVNKINELRCRYRYEHPQKIDSKIELNNNLNFLYRCKDKTSLINCYRKHFETELQAEIDYANQALDHKFTLLNHTFDFSGRANDC